MLKVSLCFDLHSIRHLLDECGGIKMLSDLGVAVVIYGGGVDCGAIQWEEVMDR